MKNSFGFFCFDKLLIIVDGKPVVNEVPDMRSAISTSMHSDTLSADLKRRGFRNLGSTTCYAIMQSAGLVNDHVSNCFRKKELIGGATSTSQVETKQNPTQVETKPEEQKPVDSPQQVAPSSPKPGETL